MILTFPCKSCGTNNSLKKHFSDRVDLSKKMGDSFSCKCKNCEEKNSYTANDIYAQHGSMYSFLLIGMIVASASLIYYLTIWIESKNVASQGWSWFLLAIAITIPSLLFFNWLMEEKNKIRNFNKYKV